MSRGRCLGTRTTSSLRGVIAISLSGVLEGGGADWWRMKGDDNGDDDDYDDYDKLTMMMTTAKAERQRMTMVLEL